MNSIFTDTHPAYCPTLDCRQLNFSRFDPSDIARVREILSESPGRTCDFTVGGIFMWADYFDYRKAIVNDTLFVKGMSELDITQTAFSLPIGKLPLKDSIAILRGYCDAKGIALRLSAVPEQALASLEAMGGTVIDELTDWADYLYDIAPMASYSGKKMSKKRNHVNAFTIAHPNYIYESLTEGNVREVRDFYAVQELAATKGITAEVERMQTLAVLESIDDYRFEGGVLRVDGGEIVAFTLGEVQGDTLFVHIEKMRHDIPGSGETIAKLFAADMMAKHHINYVNREEDTGDEGLRQAKLSYHPSAILRKFDVEF